MDDPVETLDELELEVPFEDDGDIVEVPIEKRAINTEKKDPEIKSLHEKWKLGWLNIQPDFQRQFVWDKGKCSRLIESAILGIPLPIFYFSQEEEGKEYVIDGQQRLTAFFAYIDGIWPEENKPFKLTGLTVFKELVGKTFKDLDKQTQFKIRDFSVRTITFKEDSDPELKFEIFERLNTGAVPLNDQELRNCMYRGPYNELIREISKYQDFKDILGISTLEKRMRDAELVLRFASFFHESYLNYKPSIKKFLNNDMKKYQNIRNEEAADLRKAFKDAVMVVRSLFGTNAFRRYHKGSELNPNGYWEKKQFNVSLYDVLMWSFAREDKNVIFQNLDAVKEAFVELMTTNQDFIDSILLSTSSLQAVTKRFDIWRKTLEDIVGIRTKEPRAFTKEFKNSLFDKNPTCMLCGNEIQDIDDAHVDHWEDYAHGGKTIPDNAKLAHRYCNWAKKKKGAPAALEVE